MTLALSSDLVARAIVASARVFGDDPVLALSVSSRRRRRCLAPSVVAIAWATERTKNAVCGLLGVSSGGVSSAETLAAPTFVNAVEAAKAACLDGVLPPASPAVIDGALVAGALQTRDLTRCAALASIPQAMAFERLKEIGRAIAATVGAGFMDPAMLSGKPDALVVHVDCPPDITPPRPPPVAPREAVAAQLAAGLSNRDIAKALDVSIGKVAGIRQRIKEAARSPAGRPGAAPVFSGLARLGSRELGPSARAPTRIADRDRALIDAAIAGGRVKVMPAAGAEEGHSPGVCIAQPKPLEFDPVKRCYRRAP